MVFGSVYDSINESALNAVAPYEFDESMSIQEMGAQMIEEATQDWNNYMEAVALTELSYVIENHKEYLYEAVDISTMINKVKDWFKKLWAKIQGITKAALAKFNSFRMDGEKFIDKYEKDIKEGAGKLPSGFSYKGYKFEGLAAKANTIGKEGKWTNSVISIPDSYGSTVAIRSKYQQQSGKKDTDYLNSKHTAEMLDKYRGSLLNKGSVSSGDFKKAVKTDLYGSANKEYIRTVDATKLIDIVKNAKDAISGAKNAESDIKSDIDEKIDALETLESKLKSDMESETNDDVKKGMGKSATVASNTASFLQQVETINTQWFSIYINALKDQNRQAKAICTKLISYANGVGGAKDESAHMSGSLLEGRFQELLNF